MTLPTQKDQFDALMKLAQLRRDRANYRDTNQWKISFAVWALLASLIYYQVQGTVVYKGSFDIRCLLVPIIAMHAYILMSVWGKMKIDVNLAWKYIGLAEAIVADNEKTIAEEKEDNRSELKADKPAPVVGSMIGDYSLMFQVATTLLLAFVFLGTVPPTKDGVVEPQTQTLSPS